MRLQRLELIRVPSGPVLVDESLAEGTLGTGEMWRWPVSWDADANRGATFELRLTGHRIGAPTMTQINAYRVDGDGVLHDLAEVVTLAAYGK